MERAIPSQIGLFTFSLQILVQHWSLYKASAALGSHRSESCCLMFINGEIVIRSSKADQSTVV